MKYAKLIDGYLVFAPRKLPVGEYLIYNPTPEMLVAAGYKPVTYTDPPTEPGEGYQWAETWSETESEIVQGWVLVEVPITEEDALVRYSNELTGAEDGTLLDATETLIKIVKEDM